MNLTIDITINNEQDLDEALPHIRALVAIRRKRAKARGEYELLSRIAATLGVSTDELKVATSEAAGNH